MKNTLSSLFIFLLVISVMIPPAFADSAKERLEKLQAIEKDAQWALDMWDIENLMTRMAQQNKLGMKPGDAAYQETAAQKTEGVSFGVDGDYIYGTAARNAIAGQGDQQMLRTGPSNMHMVTTGHIQVADDGKTAKGLWYSPGFLNETGTDGNPKSAFDYKRYAVDFVKEDGQWRIWHFAAFTDWTTLPNVSWTNQSDVSDTTIDYRTLQETKGAESKYQVPRAYNTFSETFSYSPEESSTK